MVGFFRVFLNNKHIRFNKVEIFQACDSYNIDRKYLFLKPLIVRELNSKC